MQFIMLTFYEDSFAWLIFFAKLDGAIWAPHAQTFISARQCVRSLFPSIHDFCLLVYCKYTSSNLTGRSGHGFQPLKTTCQLRRGRNWKKQRKLLEFRWSTNTLIKMAGFECTMSKLWICKNLSCIRTLTTLMTHPTTASSRLLRLRCGGKSLRESATYTDEFGEFVCKKFAEQAGLLLIWALVHQNLYELCGV